MANVDYIVQGELMTGQFHESFSTLTVTDFVYHHVADETLFSYYNHKIQLSSAMKLIMDCLLPRAV